MKPLLLRVSFLQSLKIEEILLTLHDFVAEKLEAIPIPPNNFPLSILSQYKKKILSDICTKFIFWKNTEKIFDEKLRQMILMTLFWNKPF